MTRTRPGPARAAVALLALLTGGAAGCGHYAPPIRPKPTGSDRVAPAPQPDAEEDEEARRHAP